MRRAPFLVWRTQGAPMKHYREGAVLVIGTTQADRVQEIIGAFGQRAVANPLDYYYPEGHTFRDHAFSNITKYYALPAAEAEITPHF